MTDENTTERPLLKPDILTEAMNTEIEFVYKLARKPKRKKEHDTEDESDEPKKNKTVHSYKLDIEEITMIIQKGGIDKLPTPPLTGGEWTKSKLLGLSYYLKEGSVLHTEWYVEGCPPDPNL